MIKAEVVLDSITEVGCRLTTFKLTYPKFIHGEAKTHRVLRIGNEGGWELQQEVGLMDDPNLSRNASSSRAVPTKKLLDEVRSDVLRASPVWWGKNQAGMQADEELSGLDLEDTQHLWRTAAILAAECAEKMVNRGAHKQIVNRVLEPFTHIHVVATATEWGNFFGLRLDKGAQPEMRALAIAMWEARQKSTPDELTEGCWHLPFVETEDYKILGEEDGFVCTSNDPLNWNPLKVSIARCARVSYESFETGKRSSVDEDIKLCQRLSSSGHWSPFEHQATPDPTTQFYQIPIANRIPGQPHREWYSLNFRKWGNLKGWFQARKMIPGESLAPLPKEYM